MKEDRLTSAINTSQSSPFVINKYQMHMFSPMLSEESSKPSIMQVKEQRYNIKSKFEIKNKVSSNSISSSHESYSLDDDNEIKE